MWRETEVAGERGEGGKRWRERDTDNKIRDSEIRNGRMGERISIR